MNKTAKGTAYRLTGVGDSVIVLIHGLGLCSDLWSDYWIEGLLEGLSDYRILTYDLYGHGQSEPLRSPASLSVFAEQLAELLDTLNIDRAHLVGFSIGGMINRRFACDYAERVSSLVILNSPHRRDPEAQAQVESRAKAVGQGGALATMDAALERWFTPDFRKANPQTLATVRKWREMTDPASYAGAAWVLADGVKELTDCQIDAPCLVMTCEHDSGSTPAMTRDIAAQISGAQTRIIPDLQHLGLMERPDLFIPEIIDFIDSC